jgi:hypothetical protein
MIQAINASGFAVTIRESQLIYPFLQVGHLVGLCLFAGGVLVANLRLVGIGARLPLVDLVRYCARVAAVGGVILAIAGLLMVTAFAEVFYASWVMRTKLLVVLVAATNLVVLWQGSAGPAAKWRLAAPDPGKARIGVIIGIAALLTLITLGKLLAYIGGKD